MDDAIRQQAAKAKAMICNYDNMYGDEGAEEIEQAITVIITGVLHYCDEAGLNFNRALKHGRLHHKIELQP